VSYEREPVNFSMAWELGPKFVSSFVLTLGSIFFTNLDATHFPFYTFLNLNVNLMVEIKFRINFNPKSLVN
jgi:hypothetical protein